MVRDSFGSGRGQFRSHAMGFRPMPARIGLKLTTSPPEADGPASRNPRCAETARRNYPALTRNPGSTRKDRHVHPLQAMMACDTLKVVSCA